jgi:AraC-like DNA-binding protein
MGIVSSAPKASLQPFIKELYYCEFYAKEEPFVPIHDDCCYDIILFKEADSQFKFGPDGNIIPIKQRLFTIHQLPAPYQLLINNKLSFFTIKIQPWCNALILPWLDTGGIINLEAKLGAIFDDVLFERLFNTESSVEKFDLITSLLIPFMDQYALNDDHMLIKSVVERVYESEGKITVTELAEFGNLSRQSLNAKFKQKVYYTLKHFITAVRILAGIKRKVNEPEIPLTTLAYEMGYYDQAHFIKDLKQITGLTPKAFFQNLAPFFLRHRK